MRIKLRKHSSLSDGRTEARDVESGIAKRHVRHSCCWLACRRGEPHANIGWHPQSEDCSGPRLALEWMEEWSLPHAVPIGVRSSMTPHPYPLIYDPNPLAYLSVAVHNVPTRWVFFNFDPMF